MEENFSTENQIINKKNHIQFLVFNQFMNRKKD